jgi:hypothetical protein
LVQARKYAAGEAPSSDTTITLPPTFPKDALWVIAEAIQGARHGALICCTCMDKRRKRRSERSTRYFLETAD